MPIRFNCEFCNQLLSIGGSREGTQVHCPLCGGALTVPRLPPGTFDYSTDGIQAIEEDPAQPGAATRLRRAPSTDLPPDSDDSAFDLPTEEEEFASPGVRKALAVFAVGLVVALLGAGGFVVYLIVATPAKGPPAAVPPPGQIAALPAAKGDPQPPGKPQPAVNPPPDKINP